MLSASLNSAAVRIAGLAITVACWAWASRLDLSETRDTVLVWAAPLLSFPIALLGRRALDANPEPARAGRITVLAHYGLMIVLGAGLFPAIRTIQTRPSIEVVVLRQAAGALVFATGAATLLTVLNLALRGLGAPFAVRLSTRLATDWMYARARNPMLLCTLAWFLCLGIWYRSGWFLAWLTISVAPGWICFVKIYEERELEIRFGEAYAEYRRRTPFLRPRMRAQRAGN